MGHGKVVIGYGTCQGGNWLWDMARRYPKYSGLVPPSIQQLWCREAPVDGRTTMSSESVCNVARSWVEVGSPSVRNVVGTASCNPSSLPSKYLVLPFAMLKQFSFL
jgi:hypothetical protein